MSDKEFFDEQEELRSYSDEGAADNDYSQQRLPRRSIAARRSLDDYFERRRLRKLLDDELFSPQDADPSREIDRS